MYNHILVALDGSELAEGVLPYVETLAEKFGSSVTLLQAITSPEAFAMATTTTPIMGQPVFPYQASLDPNELTEAERGAALGYLQKVAESLTAQGLKVGTAEPEGPAAGAILEHARSQGIDLIAMTTHGRGGLGRLIMGSVADEVLRHAPCPLLLIRVSDNAEQEAPSTPATDTDANADAEAKQGL